MANQIHVACAVEDERSLSVLSKLHTLGKGGRKVTGVYLVDTYTLDLKLKRQELEWVAQALHSPLSQTYAIDKPLSSQRFSYAIEIGFLPGVTDNVGYTCKETISDTLGKKFSDDEKVYFSRTYFLAGSLTAKEVAFIADNMHNPLIQRTTIKSFVKFKKDGGMGLSLPRVKLSAGSVKEVDLYISDDELATLGKKGIKNDDGSYRGPLGLGLEELKNIRDYFHRLGRLPTDVETEALAQTWSEHCKHTIFANPLDDVTDGIYRHYIKRATKEVRAKKGKKDFCVSVFSDNSGILKFDADTYITHKVETHNSPSALDPFGGAITGIVGVNRDTIGTGLGAKPLLNTYGYCFADPDHDNRLWRDKQRTVELLSARRIMDGVIEGVNAGGNQSGIPTPQGFTYFEPRYRGKPLVFVGTVGVLPRQVKGRPSYEKGARPGDYIVMLGGRVGLDGIHGATFSSEALDAGSPATAVQIGDPITQKKLSDALVKEARDMGLYNSITDNGAGGLSSSVGEMAEQAGGCEVRLDSVPLKYPGLSPWQIWISESQERMTLAVPKKKWKTFLQLMESRGCEATVIGEFNDSGVCRVSFQNKTVLELDMSFMHHGNPVHMQLSKPVKSNVIEFPISVFKQSEANLSRTILKFLKRANIGGTEFISTQYDHEVQGVSVTKPLHGKGRVGATASVSRPSAYNKKGIVLSQGLCPTYSDLDTYHMAASAIDQAIRNVIVMGANPEQIALLDNFCWCSSNEPARLYQLKRAAEACYDYAVAFEAPFISGKDSMFNDFSGFDEKGKAIKISVPPTLLISSIAIIPDVQTSVTIDAKQPGDSLYLLGVTKKELGGSEFASMASEDSGRKYSGGKVPTVDAKLNRALYNQYHQAVLKGLVASAIALERGGLAAALMKTAIAGQLGANIRLDGIGADLNVTEKLFSESNGRLLVTVAPEREAEFKQVFKKTPWLRIGHVTDDGRITIASLHKKVCSFFLKEATEAYRSKFRNY